MQRPPINRLWAGALVALFISLNLWSPAGAETSAKDAIKYRHAVMEAMAGHTAAYSMIAFGMVDHQDHLMSHANALADAGAQIAVLFPEGSGEGETEALAAIWSEPEKFSEAVAAAEKATADLKSATTGGDRKAIMAAFKALGASCKGCHESFREEHEH